MSESERELDRKRERERESNKERVTKRGRERKRVRQRDMLSVLHIPEEHVRIQPPHSPFQKEQ